MIINDPISLESSFWLGKRDYTTFYKRVIYTGDTGERAEFLKLMIAVVTISVKVVDIAFVDKMSPNSRS